MTGHYKLDTAESIARNISIRACACGWSTLDVFIHIAGEIAFNYEILERWDVNVGKDMMSQLEMKRQLGGKVTERKCFPAFNP